MTETQPGDWVAENQHFLAASLERLRALLASHVGRDQPTAPAAGPATTAPESQSGSGRPAPALLTLQRLFGLSPFERDVLLLASGVDLDSGFAQLYVALGEQAPTFTMALAALPGSHWSALAPTAPLRRWQLIELGDGPSLTRRPLRASERVLHYLTGVQYLDERIAGLVRELPPESSLAPSQHELVEDLARAWSRTPAGVALPVVQLVGADRLSQLAVAVALCQRVGLRCFHALAEALPSAAADLEQLGRLWEREAALLGGALVLDLSSLDGADGVRLALLSRFVEETRGALIGLSEDRRLALQRPALTRLVQKPNSAEQRDLWRSSLGEQAALLNGTVDRLSSQFSLAAATIRAVSAQVPEGRDPKALERALWQACRAEARPHLDDLAQRVETGASWEDLVLPTPQLALLREIAGQVRWRARVYDDWGLGRSARGLGISVLFAGASGTGKTMAAEILADDLDLDLYRIDLSQVVSKYIGETEKNLRRIFDAAEEGGAVLLFDEADALFGKRSEVKDSHDRYANIEVSYLLQRMELYWGLAILTTNLRQALDQAFLRRLRFVVQFPFPDAAHRAEIWRRMFPLGGLPPTKGLSIERLAQLHIAGGNMRNMALNAAFLAAADPEPVVRMAHLRRAAFSEYAKSEKTLTEAELAGWPDD